MAFAGASYFIGLLAAWWLARAAWPLALVWIVRCGALASLVFLGLALRADTLCPYCLATNAANLAFVLPSERAARGRGPRALVAFALAALVVSAILAVARARSLAATEARDEGQRKASARIIADAPEARPFTGRYRHGPETAPIRIVLFSDYQCPDCKRLEAEAWELASTRADLALSIEHFPLCKDCNRRARELGLNPHPNACWAARAAEAAGIVAGADGFWRMHHWLFERGGTFVDADLRQGLDALALAPGPFIEALNGVETLARVQADVDEALSLGIESTPAVFVNGVELRGWRAPRALARTIEELAASRPPALGPAADHPPAAREKALEDWRQEPRFELPARDGRASAPIVLWGDFLDPATRELDARLRAWLAAHPGMDYDFRHYPLDPECVPGAPRLHPGACRLALATEAAFVLGGPEKRARMHVWSMEHAKRLDDGELRGAALSLGLDPEAFLAAIVAADTRARLDQDVAAARALGIVSIPLLYVAGRRVPRWRVAGESLLERILDEAFARR